MVATLCFALVPALIVAGGSALPETPIGTVKAVAEALNQNQPQVLWQALPATYQQDLTALTHEFAAKMDAEVYDKIIATLQKTVTLAEDKKEFILSSSYMEMAAAERADAERGYDAVVDILETLLNSEISSVESLKSIDYESFLASTGGKIMDKVAAVSKASPDDPYTNEFKAKLSDATYELVSAEGDSAVVRVTAADGESELLDLVRVEGRWVPKEMADDWTETIGSARDELANMSEEEVASNKMQILMGVAMVDSFIDQLAATSTQEEFEGVIQGLIGSFLGGSVEEEETAEPTELEETEVVEGEG
jgi:hypothetical protein